MAAVQFQLGGVAHVPQRKTAGAAGFDLCAPERVVLHPNCTTIVNTYVRAAIPEGWVGLIWPRSSRSVAFNQDINAGVIDSDYRGEIQVCLCHKGGSATWVIEPGEAIAQLVIVPHLSEAVVVETIDETQRGDGGFGSTDV